MKIVVAIIIFSLIIIFHELGHFSVAKANGICVLEFSLGLGPTIFGVTKGETKYSLKLLPFGGACMMLGEDESSEDERAFGNKSVWARMAVVFAGPFFNFILALVLSMVIIGCVGYDAPVIAGVSEGFPAEEAGMQAGDKITKLGNETIHIYREITMYSLTHSEQSTVDVTYERDGQKHTVTLTTKQGEDGRYMLGIIGSGGRVRANAWEVVKYSVFEVKYWIVTTIKSLKMMVTGRVSMNDVSGPVGIVNTIGDTYEQSKTDGWYYVFLNMMNISILLTANLGVMNLLPIPALDGGRLVFLIIEAIRGKKVDQEKEGFVHMIGLFILLALMVLIMANDIRKLF